MSAIDQGYLLTRFEEHLNKLAGSKKEYGTGNKDLVQFTVNVWNDIKLKTRLKINFY